MDNPDWRKAGVYTSYGRLLAASGFVAVTFQKRYPPGPQGLITGQIDTLDVIRYVREHATEFHADADRMAVWAFSAGGFMLAPALRDRPPYIRAVVNFYGVSDALPNMTLETQRTISANGLSPTQALERADPLPPIFVGRAGYDTPALNAALDRFAERARAQGATVQVMDHPTGRHGFDILDNDARSREIIASAIGFLKVHLAAAK
jgi:acetyl esterase/lipase